MIEIQILCARCLNTNRKRKSFPLPIKGITRYRKATDPLIKETIASNILDNIPAEKIKGRFAQITTYQGKEPKNSSTT